MSFQIFASGSTENGRPFHVRRSGLDIGDVYEAADALSQINGVPAAGRVWREGVRAGARALAIDQVQQRASRTSAHQRGVEEQGRQIGAHNLATNLVILLARCVPLNLMISVRHASTFGPPTGGNASYYFASSEINAAARLLTGLNPILTQAEMNGFGVLNAIAEIFPSYNRVAGQGADRQYRLLIQIGG